MGRHDRSNGKQVISLDAARKIFRGEDVPLVLEAPPDIPQIVADATKAIVMPGGAFIVIQGMTATGDKGEIVWKPRVMIRINDINHVEAFAKGLLDQVKNVRETGAKAIQVVSPLADESPVEESPAPVADSPAEAPAA